MKIRISYSVDISPELLDKMARLADVLGYSGTSPRELVTKLLKNRGMDAFNAMHADPEEGPCSSESTSRTK